MTQTKQSLESPTLPLKAINSNSASSHTTELLPPRAKSKHQPDLPDFSPTCLSQERDENHHSPFLVGGSSVAVMPTVPLHCAE